MRNGVKIPGAITNKCFVKQEGDNRFRIILTQGLNRQIRRMCEALGFRVTSLKRIRIMNISVSGLAPGKWRYFTDAEIGAVNEMLKNSSKTADGEGMGE
jgi:23S rRNA pseudouridine2604 synthase